MSIFECNMTVLYIENVYPLEEIILDGPGCSSKELAQWGCISSSEEQAERLQNASFVPLSNKAAS